VTDNDPLLEAATKWTAKLRERGDDELATYLERMRDACADAESMADTAHNAIVTAPQPAYVTDYADGLEQILKRLFRQLGVLLDVLNEGDPELLEVARGDARRQAARRAELD
jgi:hypothetical protein